MLHHEMARRIERIKRLRMMFVAHLAFFGALLLGYGLVAVLRPEQWHLAALALLAWLPLMLTHTAVQAIYEARQQCMTEYQFAPARATNPQMLPVELYDEAGNRLGNGDPFTFTLPPPRG